jgi:hypothetical protein
LGTVIAYVFTIEFQKRGLPHMHMILTLEEKDWPTTPEQIGLLVSAKIPSQNCTILSANSTYMGPVKNNRAGMVQRASQAIQSPIPPEL